MLTIIAVSAGTVVGYLVGYVKGYAHGYNDERGAEPPPLPEDWK